MSTTQTTIKREHVTVEPEKLTTERIAKISDLVVQDLAEVSKLQLGVGKLHIRIHFQHSKDIIIIQNPEGPVIINPG